MRVRRGFVLLICLVPGLLMVDLLNGLLGEGSPVPFLGATPGELVRGVIMVYAVVLAARRFGSLYDQPRRWLFVLLALGLIGPAAGLLHGGSAGALVFDVSSLSKSLYAPALVVLMIDLIRRYRVTRGEMLRVLALVGPVAGGSLILFTLFNVGAATYGAYAAAFRGLFLAQNDLGLAMLMSLLPATHLLLERRRLRELVGVGITIAGMLVLGTRVSTLGAVLGPLIVFGLHARDYFSWRRLPFLAGVGALVVLAFTVIGVIQYRRIAQQGFQAQRFESLAEGQFTRVLLLTGALRYVVSRPVWADVVGEGADRYERGVARSLGLARDRRPAEVDWMDLFGAQGILFTIAAYMYYILAMLRLRGAMGGREVKLRRLLALMVLIFLLHAALAGHAMANPIPGGVIALVLGWIWYMTTVEPADAKGEPGVTARSTAVA